MGRAFEKLSLADAVGRLRPGQKVLLPPGSAEPAAFIEELCRQADRLAPLTLMGGLLLGGYPFLRPEHARHFQWVTWQLMPPASAAWERGQAHLVPARYFDALSLFGRGGPWAPDVVIVHATPPDRHGYLSLGVSVSYPLLAAREAPLVIAQVNPRMPRTLGNAFLHRSQIDCWAEADHLLQEYPPTPVGEVERRIAAPRGRRHQQLAQAAAPGADGRRRDHGHRPALRLVPREPRAEHGALRPGPRPRGGGHAGRLRLHQLGA